MATLIQHTADPSTISSEIAESAIVVKTDRHTLYKRRWRATATDGTELAVDLDSPVGHNSLLLSADSTLYLIEQKKEDVLVITLPTSTQLAAQVGWYLGNQHLPVEVREDSIILEKIDTLAASLDRIGIPYTFRNDIFLCKMHSHQH